LTQERATASVLLTCRAEIERGQIDLTGSDVAFAFHVIEGFHSGPVGNAFRVFAPRSGSIALVYHMPVVTFESPRSFVRTGPSFHDLSVGQQRALAQHFINLRPLSQDDVERRGSHLREAEAFFREG
jgi:hypothetical protein